MNQPPLPLTVIGGYLGAGKTTLINQLLTDSQSERLALLINDFGEVNIDQSLIASHDGDTISLTNGCICCSLADGFASALDTVNQNAHRLDRVIIEVSGVGQPAKVALWGQSPGFYADGVVVLVNGENIMQRAEDSYVGETVLTQILGADLLLLTHTDLMEAPQVAEVTQWLATKHQAPVLESPVAPAILYGLPPTGADTDLAPVDFLTASVVVNEPLEQSTLELWAKTRPSGVIRAKGLVKISDHPENQTDVQLFGPRLVLRPHPSEQTLNTMVAIARPGTPRAALIKWLNQLSPAN
jgi:G3E family GTPase